MQATAEQVTFTTEEWETIKAGFGYMSHFLWGQPFTFTDVLDRAETVTFHKAEALIGEHEYDPSDYEDDEYDDEYDDDYDDQEALVGDSEYD